MRSAVVLASLLAVTILFGHTAGGCTASGNCGGDKLSRAETEREILRQTGAESVSCECTPEVVFGNYSCEARYPDGRVGLGYVDDGSQVTGDLSDPLPAPLARPPELESVSVTPETLHISSGLRTVTVEVVMNDESGAGPWTLWVIFYSPRRGAAAKSVSAKLQHVSGDRYRGTLTLPPDPEPGLWTLFQVTASSKTGPVEVWSEYQHPDSSWTDGVSVVP